MFGRRRAWPAAGELAVQLVGARITEVVRDESGRAMKVEGMTAAGSVRVVADGVGEGWSPGDIIAAAEIADDGTLLLVAGETAFVARPDLQFEAWHIQLPGRDSLVVCMPGGDVVVFGPATWLERGAAALSRIVKR